MKSHRAAKGHRSFEMIINPRTALYLAPAPNMRCGSFPNFSAPVCSSLTLHNHRSDKISFKTRKASCSGHESKPRNAPSGPDAYGVGAIAGLKSPPQCLQLGSEDCARARKGPWSSEKRLKPHCSGEKQPGML